MIQETAHAALGGWEDFYLIVGSAAAALTGLQFVVITLVSEAQSRSTSTGALGAFATPTIVHFCAALFVSVVMCAPWPRLPEPAFVVAAGGAVGLAYTGIVVARATRQTAYRMVAEDWIWHVTLPLVAYGVQLAAGFVLLRATMVASFTIAASSLLLVYIGIHNAWDTSTFMIEERARREAAEQAIKDSAPSLAAPVSPAGAAPAGELAAPTETR
ncbi:MAG TPA: hypothetical protein VL308_09270 [Gemmatimonadaceae bacterium]|nr:hypothetical protein [Gemmatimonadaceae bacterium]